MSNLKDVRFDPVPVMLKDGQHTLMYDLNAFADLEEKYGNVKGILAELQGEPKIGSIRAILWAGMTHENENITERQVGKLIDIRMLPDIMQALTEAIVGAQPDEEEGSPSGAVNPTTP